MAGHSQFKNIMYRKGAQDKKRARLFTKLAREITVSAKEGGDDPDSNPRLRSAIAQARANNMPNNNIERALKKATGEGASQNYEEVRYEGYGPGGVAIVVDTLTDNRNRTASEVRSAFSKLGGNLGETNSASVMFERVGRVIFPETVADFDTVFEVAAEAGADDVQHQPANEDDDEPGSYEVICQANDFSTVRDTLTERFGDPKEARLGWKPHSTQPVSEEQAQTLLKLLDTLEDYDDVQQVTSNLELDDDVMQRLSA
ncbi:YebC/PmpR family DNA-binding transcriptional regulator [Rhodovibrio salinarum]|uniref:Probable transcriptional regulatory protein CKO21_08660 n=1 Tax=Rhodovibrio salinarum TaxID=1087 RepID=A0A934UZL5_9PROT|nr:YebC/PmpR family DNA-binding transcriptional regulator [Rhodovibrio salinarum]MBK1697317.1 YebC/PmpR family DNA-binding transcriptional regulator [Rhodovibrio salinarum]